MAVETHKSSFHPKKKLRTLLFNREGGYCHWCGTKTFLAKGIVKDANQATIDHLYPKTDPRRIEVSWKRLSELAVNSCRKCNNERGNKTIEEWDRILTERQAEKRGW